MKRKILSIALITALCITAVFGASLAVEEEALSPVELALKDMQERAATMSERERRWAGLDDESIERQIALIEDMQASANSYKDGEQQGANPEEHAQLREFFTTEWDTLCTEITGLPKNMDRVNGYWLDPAEYDWYLIAPSDSEEPDLNDADYIYAIDAEGYCTEVVSFFGYLAGVGFWEGDLDVSGFERLTHLYNYPTLLNSVNASDCPSLEAVHVSFYDGGGAWIEELGEYDGAWGFTDDPYQRMEYADFSNCPMINLFRLYAARVDSLNVEGSITDALEYFYVPYNNIEGEIPDFSNATNLISIAFPDNQFSGRLVFNSERLGEIVTNRLVSTEMYQEGQQIVYFYENSTNYLTSIEILNSSGGPKSARVENGYVEMDASDPDYFYAGLVYHNACLYTVPAEEGSEFLGWYDDETGELFSMEQFIEIDYYEEFHLTARWSAAYALGDANMDGNVNTGDVATILRHTIGIDELDETQLSYADANADGTVNTGDAAYLLGLLLEM